MEVWKIGCRIIEEIGVNRLEHYVEGISFELTRRCNLHCKWCSKGDAQNVDMNKNIIDKALDEISDFYIDTIRITGGEPSLVPESIEYLIDGIIKRKIKVYDIHMMTNATIQSQKIKDSIIKYLKYSKDIKEERKKIFDYFSQDKTTMYTSTKDKDLAWVMHLSTWEHDNLSTFNDVKKFYDIKHDNYILITQDELNDREHKGVITIEGNAEKNYKLFSDKELNVVRIIHNDYCIIQDNFNETIPCITKMVSIGANGKVYVGCMKSYDNIEKDYLFNIMDCDNDFWERVDQWCWKNPISMTANVFLEKYYGLKWKYEHNIGNISKELIEAFAKIEFHIKVYEESLINYHPKLPFLLHSELNLFVVATMCEYWYEQNVTWEQLELLIKYTTGLDDETIKTMNKNTVHNISESLIKRNNDRAISNIDNPIQKFLAKLYIEL